MKALIHVVYKVSIEEYVKLNIILLLWLEYNNYLKQK